MISKTQLEGYVSLQFESYPVCRAKEYLTVVRIWEDVCVCVWLHINQLTADYVSEFEYEQNNNEHKKCNGTQ